MTERRLVIEWDNPAKGLAAMPTMSGLEYLQSMIGGQLPPPPMCELLRIHLIEASPGSATFTCQPDESHYNPIGAVHGGLVCTMLDSALGCAVQTTLPQGQGYTSIELKVNYLRPVRRGSGPLICVGRVSKAGSRVTFAEGSVTDASGKLVATATGSHLVFAL